MTTSVQVVRASDARFARSSRTGAVCVFAGATSKIGARSLERMLSMCSKLERIRNAPSCFIEADVSLISAIDKASQVILAAEGHVNYLCMSMGGALVNGVEYTVEGLDACFAISYHSRMWLLANLLLLLLRSEGGARALGVLNGGKEKFINEDDIGLKKNCSLYNIVKHTTLPTSLALGYLAAQSEKANITFVYNYPGLVKSDNFRRLNPPPSSSVLWGPWLAVVKVLVPVIRFFAGMSPEEAGERQAFHLTSDKYRPRWLQVYNGNERWRINRMRDGPPRCGISSTTSGKRA
ncbi:hypothetical protein NPX13_g4244 [Xylaria arbuscula]|uniref:Uncharacterized protein n=1 Tax=Xylaria arbuscula TaxID=114810 RepID=A0A9W8NGQ1_9PEZI|nr:hypothetical protein NPX13_g4244 [Xylaria arbuscula]